ncbi:MAG TPA: nodulation protein NfeD, partial [Gammaproteobacteria bacterium]|nr:nodulation protein NfeD [Gammaproteobacteria bacterium]
MLTVEGPIGPAIAQHIISGLENAAQARADLVILRMDTPGGLSTAMREIIKAILASPIPVVTYVAPKGARAASAGTYILYASHIAAMAPATNLGAATPVPVGGAPADKPESDSEKNNADEGSAMQHKVINDAVAYIRGLAELRGRNADWAEQAVREAASLPAEQALEKNVIDVMATDVADLLQKIDGKTVIIDGQAIKLDTSGMVIEKIETDWRTDLLSILTNPTIAYMLMLAGIYGLMFEGFNPGAILPGVVGAVCLLLALFAFQLLPVNYAGVALIVLGIGFMVGEMFVPSFGALGLGGLI